MIYPIDVYKGISQTEIEATRKTSEGKEYTLNHPQELVVNMRYKGIDSSSANSQGWERSYTYYFKELLANHPEYFSKKNTLRIQNGESPRVDARFIQAFPQFEGFENEILIHHHVGKDGQAVAVPQSIHKGSGEIHNYENKLGITVQAEAFSEECRILCENNPEMMNQTSDQFKASFRVKDQKEESDQQDSSMLTEEGKGQSDKNNDIQIANWKERKKTDSDRNEEKYYVDRDGNLQHGRVERRPKLEETRKMCVPKADPLPKSKLGKLWYNVKMIGKAAWNNNKDEIIAGGVYCVVKGGEKIINHISNNKTSNSTGIVENKKVPHSPTEEIIKNSSPNPNCDDSKISQVRAHTRKLPEGYKASPEKRATAGKNDNPVIGSDETWVKEHPSKKKKN